MAWSHGRSWLSASYLIGVYHIRDAPKLNWGIAFRLPSSGSARSGLAEERLVADRLDVVTIGVVHERPVVVLVIVRADAGRAVVLRAGGHRGGVELADDRAAGRTERDVDAVVRLAARPSIQKLGLAGSTPKLAPPAKLCHLARSV